VVVEVQPILLVVVQIKSEKMVDLVEVLEEEIKLDQEEQETHLPYLLLKEKMVDQ
jgi:hypothetical protein